MKINPCIYNPFYNKQKTCKNQYKDNLHSYNIHPADTVNFSAMKKLDFKGIDFVVVEKFKAPIEKFRTISDFQKWAKKEIEIILGKDYSGRRLVTGDLRQRQLKEWSDYILKENEVYTAPIALFILSSITAELSSKNDKLLPLLNKGVLADTISDIENRLQGVQRSNINFNKEYEAFLKASCNNKNINAARTQTEWVIIPSKQNDSENFESNVEKLKILSHKNWCTKSLNAAPYLSQGDFHIYMVNGKPKIGIRFKDDAIQEIQGEYNNSTIPVTYLDNVKEYITLGGYSLNKNAQHEIDAAEKARKIIKEIKEDIAKTGKCDIIKVLDCLDFNPEQDKDGNITLSHYILPEGFTLKEFGLKESDLFSRITSIKGNVVFRQSEMTTPGVLKHVGGFLDIQDSNITSLGNLEYIGGDANFEYSKIKSLEKLKYIGGNADFEKTPLEDLGKLKYVGGNADFYEVMSITTLGELEYVGGNLCLDTTNVEDLRNLEYIGGNAVLWNCKVKTLKNLKTIGGDADFTETTVEDLGCLTKIGGKASFAASKIKTLAKLEEIGGCAIFDGSLPPLRLFDTIMDEFIDFSNVYEMLHGEKDISYYNSRIKDIGNLKSIAGIPVMTYLLAYYPGMLFTLQKDYNPELWFKSKT